MSECEEIHEFRLFDLTEENELETIRVKVRFASDNGMAISAEALEYATEDDEKMIKVTQDRQSRMIKRLIEKKFDKNALRAVMETHPAFDGMPFDEPPVSQQTYQDMRI